MGPPAERGSPRAAVGDLVAVQSLVSEGQPGVPSQCKGRGDAPKPQMKPCHLLRLLDEPRPAVLEQLGARVRDDSRVACPPLFLLWHAEQHLLVVPFVPACIARRHIFALERSQLLKVVVPPAERAAEL